MPSTYSTIRKNIRLDCTHRVFFTKDSFSMANDTLSEILQPHLEGRRTKTLVYLDEGILDGNPNLPERIESYFRGREERLDLVASPIFIRGGEAVKVGRIEADTESAVQQCHRRWNGAAGADGLFDGVCSFQVSGMRKAVGDDGRLEGHDRCTCVQRLGNLVAEPDRSIGF